jgi:NAD-dependent DNA ligase
MAEYVLLSGKHSVESGGGGARKRYYPGDVVEMSDAEYEAFKDKFDPAEESGDGLTRSEVINLVGESAGKALIKAGFASLSAIDDADDDELLEIDGVGPATLNKLRGV